MYIVIFIFVITLLALIAEIIYCKKNNKSSLMLGLLFSITVFINVAIGALIILYNMKYDSESVLLWLLYIILGKPISLLYNIYNDIFSKILAYDFFIINYIMPCLFFIVILPLQYFIFGIIIGKVLSANKRSRKNYY